MKKSIAVLLSFLFVAAVLPFYPCTTADALSDYSMIKVKLTTNNATSLVMTSSGDFFINDNGASFGKGTLTIRAAGGTLTATHSEKGLLYTGDSFTIMRSEISPSGGYLRFNSRSYLGNFNIRITSSGYIQVVNVVPLAHYLYGVVGYEMSNIFPIEALKAQAIAAKSYVLSQITASSNAEYYIGDTSSDQVYKGYSSANTNVIAAVDSTLSEILTVNGSLLCTYYAASNGGETNLVTYAWPSKNTTDAGYAISIDSYDFQNSMSTLETVDVPIGTSGQITKALYDMLIAKASAALGQTVTSIDAISAVSAHTPKYVGVTRNMTKLTVMGSFSTIYGSYPNVELTFGTSELYSYGVVKDSTLRIYWGEYSADMTHYYIYHARWGHGVGMSQRGAQARANAGYTYRDILSFYYPGAAISNITVTTPTNPVNPGTGTATTSTPTPYIPTSGGGTELEIAAYGILNGEGVNLRTGPATTYPSLAKLSYGTNMEIYETVNGWYHVTVNGTEGFLSTAYVQITGSPTSQATPTLTPSPTPSPTATIDPNLPAVISYGITSGEVNFRTGPATSYAIIKTLEKGTALSIYSKDSHGWYYVNVNGTTGYLSGSYVDVTAAATPSPTAAPTPTPRTVTTGMITADGVNMRSGAGTNYNTLRQLSKNTGIYVIVQNGKWYNIEVSGISGYVYSDYVKITGTSTVSSDTSNTQETVSAAEGKGVTTGNVNIRKEAAKSSDRIGTLDKGTVLTLYALKDGWYKVKTANGTEGYVSSKYVEVTVALPESAIVNNSSVIQIEEAKIIGLGETTGTVNFRESPSSSGKKITQLVKSTTVKIYALSNGWYEAEYQGTHGYIYAKYVKMTAQVTDTPTSSATTATGITSDAPSSSSSSSSALEFTTAKSTGKLNLRDKPSKSGSSVLTVMSAGSKFGVIGVCGEWYYVIYDGKIGYVYKAYCTLVSSGTADIPTVSSSTSSYSTTTTAEVNMRSGPGTSFAKIKLLSNKTAIEVLLIVDGWCLVRADGSYGYIVKDYVKLS